MVHQHYFFRKYYYDYDKNNVTPDDFTIIIRNIPRNFKSLKRISQDDPDNKDLEINIS